MADLLRLFLNSLIGGREGELRRELTPWAEEESPFRKKGVYLGRDRETRENRESLYGLLLLVRTLPVVCGSWNSKGVSAIDSNRERRENREQKREWPQEASPPLSESSAESDLP